MKKATRAEIEREVERYSGFFTSGAVVSLYEAIKDMTGNDVLVFLNSLSFIDARGEDGDFPFFGCVGGDGEIFSGKQWEISRVVDKAVDSGKISPNKFVPFTASEISRENANETREALREEIDLVIDALLEENGATLSSIDVYPTDTFIGKIVFMASSYA